MKYVENIEALDCSSVANSSFGARYLITLYLVPIVSSSSLPSQFMQY